MKNSNLPKYKKCNGFKSPNYTNVPDEFLDFYVPYLSESELKVSLYIIRRTFGFKKEADSISLSQLENGIVTRDGRVLDYGTGLSRPSIVKAIKGLLEKGIIEKSKNKSQNGGDAATTYKLHMYDNNEGGVNNFNPPSKKFLPQGVNNFNPQETVLQKTDLYSNRKYSKNEKDKNEGRGGGMKSMKAIIQSNSRASLKRDTVPLETMEPPVDENIPVSKTDLPYNSPQALTELEALTVQFSKELGDSENVKSNLTQSKRIFQEARKRGIDQQTVIDFMRKLRGDIQLDYSPEINGSKMGYFYKALRNNLLLSNKLSKSTVSSP